MKQEFARESQSGHDKLKVSSLEFSAIPHQSRLFLEYLRNPVSLRKFYPNAAVSPSDIISHIPEVLAGYSVDRSELCAALIDINTKAGVGEETLANIRLLRDSETVAVVTGQQAGLFTGPIYTMYKALTAIKMAAFLKDNGVNAVPVFWAATEDHDFGEVSETSFIANSGELFRSKYQPDTYVEDLPVGSVEIDGGIVRKIEEIFEKLPRTEFSADVRALISSSWQERTKFGDAFLKTVAQMLGKFGLILFDPMNSRIKRLSAPIYIDTVRNAELITQSVIQRSRELESEGFHTQVVVGDDYFPMFWHDDAGQRKALRKFGDGVYKLKGNSRKYEMTELEKTAAENPERFSPGVMLRPVVQDFLLPTACYFGGAAEIAYFAQNSGIYRVLNRRATPIFHRQSFTVVEAKQRRILRKLEVDFEALFVDKEDMRIRLAESSVAPETAVLFTNVEETINAALSRLDAAVSQIDVTLAENLTGRRRKILYHIAALRRKTLLAQVRIDEVAGRRFDNVFAALFPDGELQERSINVFSFLNKYGMNFLDWVYEAIDLNDKDHRIIDL